MINTLFLTVAVESSQLLLSFRIRKHTSMASRAILSNLFEEQRTQNHRQYLSGLSRAKFFDPTTLPEIAVSEAGITQFSLEIYTNPYPNKSMRLLCCCKVPLLNLRHYSSL